MSFTKGRGKKSWQGAGRGKQPRSFYAKSFKYGKGVETRSKDSGNEKSELKPLSGNNTSTERASAMGVGIGEYNEVVGMRTQYQLGGMDSLASYAENLLQKWGSEYLPPERKRGESPKKYAEREAKIARSHYEKMVRKIQGMISSATMGASAVLASEGVTLKDGCNIILEGRPVVNAGGRKADWLLPVAAFQPSEVGKK
jgi:hypothetical protein